MQHNVLREKSIAFGARIVKLKQFLLKKNEKELASQVIRSGTSVGANVMESQYAQSRADFISKLHIAAKEAAETEYWLLILQAAEILSTAQAESLLQDCRELQKLLISSLNTAKKD